MGKRTGPLPLTRWDWVGIIVIVVLIAVVLFLFLGRLGRVYQERSVEAARKTAIQIFVGEPAAACRFEALRASYGGRKGRGQNGRYRWDWTVCRLNGWQALPPIHPGDKFVVPDWRTSAQRRAEQKLEVARGVGKEAP